MNVHDMTARLALAIHEADLGEPCKAHGKERAKHIAAYQRTADRFIERLHRRWQPKSPPPDVSA